jgi:phosphopantothenoylcysteine decarboxylase/phosphopantothenate--cysteine ligase
VLKNKNILIGITGSVAAYKTIDLIKKFRSEGASVRTIMTESSQKFITPLSIEIASGEAVCLDMFASPMSHIALPASADFFVVAPATANIIGKYANAIADDLLSTALLACSGKVIIAPAMNWRMYENPAVQKNISYLKSIGVAFVGPYMGSLACGEEGIGRMADIDEIVETVKTVLTPQDMTGEKIVVTAGPTREYIDPVRFISNRSSGKMGFAIAKAAKRRGADVTLITGPVSLKHPKGINTIETVTADQMYPAVMENTRQATMLIMAAAVSDFKPAETSSAKVEKTDMLSINLLKTNDIIAEAGRSKRDGLFIAGFAAETGDRLDRAKKKLSEKNLDLIIFNDVSKEGSGFDVDTNEITIIDKKGETAFPLMSKDEAAMAILDKIMSLKKQA